MIYQDCIISLVDISTASKKLHPSSSPIYPTSPSRQLLQIRQRPIKNITIPPISITVLILPNGLKRPTPRNSPRASGAIPRQHQGTRRVKGRAVARARGPPIVGAVDHRISRRLAVVGVDEILDPGYHGGFGEAVAGRARGVVFDVEHAGQGDAVAGPAAAVRDEVVGLRRAGAGVGVGEVVASADEACGCSAVVVGAEAGVDVAGAFGCLRSRQSSVIGAAESLHVFTLMMTKRAPLLYASLKLTVPW